MKVELYLFATLSKYLPQKTEDSRAVIEIDEKASVEDIIKKLEIPEKNVKIVFVNGVHGSMDTVLEEGDRVGIFPPIGGG